jgi:hypothetical protein
LSFISLFIPSIRLFEKIKNLFVVLIDHNMAIKYITPNTKEGIEKVSKVVVVKPIIIAMAK